MPVPVVGRWRWGTSNEPALGWTKRRHAALQAAKPASRPHLQPAKDSQVAMAHSPLSLSPTRVYSISLPMGWVWGSCAGEGGRELKSGQDEWRRRRCACLAARSATREARPLLVVCGAAGARPKHVVLPSLGRKRGTSRTHNHGAGADLQEGIGQGDARGARQHRNPAELQARRRGWGLCVAGLTAAQCRRQGVGGAPTGGSACPPSAPPAPPPLPFRPRLTTPASVMSVGAALVNVALRAGQGRRQVGGLGLWGHLEQWKTPNRRANEPAQVAPNTSSRVAPNK